MRISDWSSGVCSSDLRERTTLSPVVRAHRDKHVFDRNDQHQRPEDQAQHAEDVQPIHCEGVRPDEAFLQRIERRGADVAEHDADSARSEEHTSELQSLMRISYAVFCLKKKKTTYTQTRSQKED